MRGTLVICLLLASCGTGGDTPTPAPRPRSTATIKILEPQSLATIPGPDVTVKLELTGGRVVPKATRKLTPDTGHIHILADGKVLSQTYGTEQSVKLTPGEHLMQAEFVAADHSPFNPRVITTVTFTVS